MFTAAVVPSLRNVPDRTIGVMIEIAFSTVEFSYVVPSWALAFTTRVTEASPDGAVTFRRNAVVLRVSVVGLAWEGTAPDAPGPVTYHWTVYDTVPIGPPARVRLYTAVSLGASEDGPVNVGTSGTCPIAGTAVRANPTRSTASARKVARGANSAPPPREEQPDTDGGQCTRDDG